MKNRLGFLTILSLFSFTSGKSQNKQPIFPPESFSVVDGKLSDGKPMIGSFNMGYKNYGLKNHYPWCLTINIGLDLHHVTDKGLPTKSESDIANKLEDRLIQDIKKLTALHYIGHLYNDTFLDIYAYVDDPEKVNSYLQSQVNKKGLIRGFGFKMVKDPHWEKVKMFLK